MDVEIIVQRAGERFPGQTPEIVNDNSPLFVAKNFNYYAALYK